jgi:hypothetical protein
MPLLIIIVFGYLASDLEHFFMMMAKISTRNSVYGLPTEQSIDASIESRTEIVNSS